jgi:hypothetical protein
MSEVYRMISNQQNTISSLEVIAQLEFLQADRAKLAQGWTEESGTPTPTAVSIWDKHYGNELAMWEKLNDQLSRFPHWASGTALIRDSYFLAYAREQAFDLGDLKRDAKLINVCVDWDKVADLLKQDYFQVDIDGVTYWIQT